MRASGWLAALLLAAAAPPAAAQYPGPAAGFGDGDIDSAFWVDEARLVHTASEPGLWVREGGGGAFAVDRDDSHARPLLSISSVSGPTIGEQLGNRVPGYEWAVGSAARLAGVMIERVDCGDEAHGFNCTKNGSTSGGGRKLSRPAVWPPDSPREPDPAGGRGP